MDHITTDQHMSFMFSPLSKSRLEVHLLFMQTKCRLTFAEYSVKNLSDAVCTHNMQCAQCLLLDYVSTMMAVVITIIIYLTTVLSK